MALKLLTTTTTGQILTENNQGCQEPRRKGTGIHKHPVRQWGLFLPLGATRKGFWQGTGEASCSFVLGAWGFYHGATSSIVSVVTHSKRSPFQVTGGKVMR